jgi:tetratricopeptide (TPR) repeat protein
MARIALRFQICLGAFVLAPVLLLAGQAENAFNEGVKYYKAEKYKEAVAAFTRAIKASPRSDEAYNNRGLAHFKLRQNDDAIKGYDEALMRTWPRNSTTAR